MDTSVETKVFIRRYLAKMLGVSSKTIYRKFWPNYGPLAMRKYLISKGFRPGRDKPAKGGNMATDNQHLTKGG